MNRRTKSVEERFWAKVDRTEGCWNWTASRNSGGYGQLNVGRRPLVAHRVAYQLLVGEIPDGLQLDHLCRNRACVNPTHLQPVTSAENTRRGLLGALKTHCKKGHPYTAGVYKYTADGYRTCRICIAESRKARVDRAKAVTDLGTACPRGHALVAPNLIYSTGSPSCRECKRIRSREYRARKRAAA